MTGQEDLIVSHSRFMQKVNPSFFGMNNMNKTGVLYNSVGLLGNVNIESKYFFGAISTSWWISSVIWPCLVSWYTVFHNEGG